MKRPELKRMLKHIEQGLVDCVLVYRLDRLTRSVIDLYKLLEIFDKYNCKFKSATEVYDTTSAMGRMFITIVAALAQWERENLSERVRMGMEQKAKEGKWVINIPPFGYEIDKENDTLLINKDEAEIVRKIYDLYLSGKGMLKIANELNVMNIKTKTGRVWTREKISYVLRNPVYKGTMRYNYRVNTEQYFEIENAVPAIIDKDIFNKVQKIINDRSVVHPRSATSKFIFSGVAKCSRCGAPMCGKYGGMTRGNKKYVSLSYVCSNKALGLCDQKNMSERFIEQHFLKELEKIKIETDILTDVSSTKDADRANHKISSLRAELELLEKRRKKWQYAWVNEMLTDEDFTKRMNEENLKEEEIKKQLSSLHPINEKMSPNEMIEVLNNVRENWEHMDSLEKKMLLQMLVKRIDLDKIGDRPVVESLVITDIEFY
ncbi:recombinase family protein [Metabacillus sp. Hm71]|uniref:recombinase family protein n=1 Tax=Metabacillus sp. Hm71 TaxID=3450743 RepID=UPI003F440311